MSEDTYPTVGFGTSCPTGLLVFGRGPDPTHTVGVLTREPTLPRNLPDKGG